MKICTVCGNTENDNVKECSNCGNVDLRAITKASYGHGRFSGKYSLNKLWKEVYKKEY